MTPSSAYLLGDIGGTSTRLALCRGGEIISSSLKRFDNAGIVRLEELIADYIQTLGTPKLLGACLAIAGPVTAGIAKMSNLNWQIQADSLRAEFGFDTVHIINDLEALAYALPALKRADLSPLIQPKPGLYHAGSQMVIGVGTGFNTAVLHRDNSGNQHVSACESGHMRLVVQDAQQLALADYAAHQPGFCAVEDVLSGRGLEAIYRWKQGGVKQVSSLSAAHICAALARGEDATATAAAALCVKILGATMGDLALSHLPFGGIYLAGGVASNLAPYFERFELGKHFAAKGRNRHMMGAFSVNLIRDDFAPLLGCAAYSEICTPKR